MVMAVAVVVMFRIYPLLKRAGVSYTKMEHQHLQSIFQKSVNSVKPKSLLRKCVRVENSNLIVYGNRYRLQRPCYLVGFGKAVFGMSIELENILGTNLKEGIITVPVGTLESLREDLRSMHSNRICYIEGGACNLPDENAFVGAQKIKHLIENLEQDDLVIVLISGGGSALLPLPKHPIALCEKIEVVKNLSNRGAGIIELNCVRKRLSQLKGGGLAKLAYPSNVISLILSDVIGDPLDFIASGPTVPNTDSSEAALQIIKKYSLYDKLSESIKTILESENQSDACEVPISNGKFAHVENYVIGNNQIAAQAALEEATALGYESFVLSTSVSGEVTRISKIYAELAREVTSLINFDKSNNGNLKVFLQTLKFELNISDSTINKILNLNFKCSRGICLIAAGEPTVVVKGKGKGGRNQQLALGFSVEVNKFDIKSANISFLSCGTDGIDGPTDAAGAVGSFNLVNNALEENIDPTQFLSNNDSYSFYSQYNSGHNLIHTGHTGTNVMDIHILIVSPNIKIN